MSLEADICPGCGRDGPMDKVDEPFAGARTCPGCTMTWARGERGRGLEYWVPDVGWTRAEPGCLLVLAPAEPGHWGEPG